MSAYMVEDSTINRFVCWIMESREQWIKFPLKELGLIPVNNEMAEFLGRSMFVLNVSSINQRYGEGQAEEFRPLDYKFNYETANTIQALKSLACFLYQACEGDCENDPLYKALEMIRGKMAYHIVSNSKEYERASWS